MTDCVRAPYEDSRGIFVVARLGRLQKVGFPAIVRG
ncbi:MAG: hypothetical protein QG585_313 [Patescibacteria group bacterium]|jgi:hypothetical protein|nr:hypothetical protein [Patescibacteria group bacterium]